MAFRVPFFEAMGKLRLGIATALVVAAPVFSQTDERPAFEVASVKPADPNLRGGEIDIGKGGVTLKDIGVLHLISLAYDVPEDRIADAPAWTGSATYDIHRQVAGVRSPHDER